MFIVMLSERAVVLLVLSVRHTKKATRSLNGWLVIKVHIPPKLSEPYINKMLSVIHLLVEEVEAEALLFILLRYLEGFHLTKARNSYYP